MNKCCGKFKKFNKQKQTTSCEMVYQPASDEEFFELTKSGKVIVDFSAQWCGPCKMISPYFDELSKHYGDKLKFLKVDVDELEDASSKAGVSAMPSFYVYKDGQIIDQLVGASKEKLEALVKKHSN